MEGNIVWVQPPLFDVIPGQQVLLNIMYNEAPLQQINIGQSDYQDLSNPMQLNCQAGGGIATTSITRGGYYWVEVQVSVGAVVGIVVGVLIGVGGIGALWWKLRHNFSYGGKKAHLMDTASTQA